MIKIDIQYNCGCGFKTDNQEKAIDHSVEKGHTLDVTGIIRYTDKLPKK